MIFYNSLVRSQCFSFLQFCDFGGAVQVLSTVSSVSSVGSLAKVATRAFSAPELFKGEPKSPATDMYAFGILLWEFATCDVPFADYQDLTPDIKMPVLGLPVLMKILPGLHQTRPTAVKAPNRFRKTL